MSNITYMMKNKDETIKDGVRTVKDVSIIDGTRGLSIKLYEEDSKKGTKTKTLIIKEGDKYIVKKTNDGQTTEETLNSLKELQAYVKKNLNFAETYVNTMKGGRRKLSRKSSRKTSRKLSKKSSRKSKH